MAIMSFCLTFWRFPRITGFVAARGLLTCEEEWRLVLRDISFTIWALAEAAAYLKNWRVERSIWL